MIKYCQRCGVKIADTLTCSQQRFAALKYCDNCVDIVRRDLTAARLRKFRKRNREELDLRREQNRLLVEQNKMLKEALIRAREELRRFQNAESAK